MAFGSAVLCSADGKMKRRRKRQQPHHSRKPGASGIKFVILLILNTKVIKDSGLWVLYLGQWKVMKSTCSY